jgi:phosphate transport system permease protein
MTVSLDYPLAEPAERAPAFRGSTSRRVREATITAVLLLCAALSVATTAAIIWALASETFAFFRQVSPVEFLTGTRWAPLFSDQAFGVLPLLSATLLIAACSMLIAVPAGLAAAVFMSEYAGERLRSLLKPALEVLAGIPTVVYGFFALSFISPWLGRVFPDLGVFSAAAAGIAVGILIIPFVASVSEDALRAVPTSLREAAYALGASRFQVASRVVVPAALSGVLASFMLGASRAVGETMVVVLAAGGQPNLSWNPLEAMQTMTAYIAAVSLGDTPFGTVEYRTIFAVGMTLFVITFAMNLVSQWLVAHFREEYE